MTVAAVVVAGAVSLSGCGASGVMHDGNVGASSGDVTVSTSAVEKATDQINETAGGQQRIQPANIIPFIVLAPQFDKLAQKYDIGINNQQIESKFPKVKLADATLDAYRSNFIYATSQAEGAPAALQQAAQDIMRNSKIVVNPRFGAVSQGEARNASRDWITYLPVNTDELGLPGGHQPAS